MNTGQKVLKCAPYANVLKDVETLSCLLSPASSWHLTDKEHNELLSIFVARDQSACGVLILNAGVLN